MSADGDAGLSREILRYLRDVSGRPLKPKEIARGLEIRPAEYRRLKSLLREMVEKGDLYRVKRGRYAPPDKINLVVGRFSVSRRGGGTVTADPPSTDAVFIPPGGVNGALHGDRVACRLMARRSGPLPEGEITRVIERARTEIVGTLHAGPHLIVVDPEDPQITRQVLVPPDSTGGAEDGQMVAVEVVSWGDQRTMMVGRVKEVIGRPGDPGLDVLIVMKDFGLPSRFPEDVEDAARRLPPAPIPDDLRGRLDLRAELCVTIDPADARDFDDALSIRALDGGAFEVGVHIADVSHYVRPGSVIDREAYRRGTSVYLVDRVVPMLPEALSSHLCSLVPGEDRLAFSVFVRLDGAGNAGAARFTRSVIRSARRFTYQEVQDILDGGGAPGDDRRLVEPLRGLAELSRRLGEGRRARGSLDFDLPESRVILDDFGLPIDIQRVIRLEAHRLVESFMLLANEAVAKRVRRAEYPALYRVHEAPDPMTIDELRAALARLGIKLTPRKEQAVTPRHLQRVLEAVAGRPEEELVNTLVLRSMKRARYDPEPRGHFGLATRNYTHFTSPIRRYPDLVVHRVLKSILARRTPPAEDDGAMIPIAEHTSERERIAEEAERASVELKKVQFMAERIGEVYSGRIVGVNAFGFFVELSTYHVTGLVHVNRLEDDYYIFREDSLTLIGERTGRRFRLGDDVVVQVTRADIARREIDFDLEPQPGATSRKRRA
jgi:ribonuclease R